MSNPTFGCHLSERRAVRSRTDHKVAATAVTAGHQPRASPTCLCCGKDHHVAQCEVLRHRPPQEKIVFVRDHGLCFGCMRKGHVAKDCAARRTCSVCKRRHPTALHNWQVSFKPGDVPVTEEVEPSREGEKETQVKSCGVELNCAGSRMSKASIMMSIL